MRLIASSIASTLVLGAVTAAPALADEAASPQVFTTLDDTADGSKVDAELAFLFDPEEPGEDVLARLDLHGQYVGPNGFGGYAAIAASVLTLTDDDEGAEAIGNLQLGGLYQKRLDPRVDLGLRAGLILPTASDNFDGLLHAVGTAVFRPSDAAAAVPDVTWLRLGVSPTFHDGAVFLRGDLGVDVPIAEDEGVEGEALLHANLGIGVAQGNVAIAAELQNVTDLDDSEWIHAAALSLRYRGSVSPYVTVSSPLDDALRGELMTVAVGLSAAL